MLVLRAWKGVQSSRRSVTRSRRNSNMGQRSQNTMNCRHALSSFVSLQTRSFLFLVCFLWASIVIISLVTVAELLSTHLTLDKGPARECKHHSVQRSSRHRLYMRDHNKWPSALWESKVSPTHASLLDLQFTRCFYI